MRNLLREWFGVQSISDLLLRNGTPDQQPLKFRDIYKYEKVLGNGAFGVVVRVELVSKEKDNGNSRAAVKVTFYSLSYG